MRRTQIYLDITQHRELKHIAVDRDISLSELIRRLLDEGLERIYLELEKEEKENK